MENYYAYIAECADGSLYSGYCKDLKAREHQHNAGQGAKYTRGKLPVRFVYWEGFTNRSEAMRRESAFKKLTRSQKLSLVQKG